MRRYLVFFTVCLALAFFSISGSAVAVAFPVMTSYYNTSLVTAGWVLTAHQLVSTIIMPLAGKISDAFGRKTTFIAYNLLFTGSSVLCAFAPNIELLILFRILQGIGGGGFLPCAAGIVSEEFPESRQRYLGLFTSIFPIGAIIGPNLGGWLVQTFGWKSIFWFNVPLGILVLIFVRLFFHADKKEKTVSSIDFAGAGLLFASLFSLMLCLTKVGNADSGIPWAIVGIALVVGVIFMVAFVWRERRVKEPVIDLQLLKERPFLAANIYNIIYGLTALGIFSLIPLYAVTVYDMTILQSGVILTSRSVGTIIASTVTSMSLMTWGYRKPILTGTAMAILGLFLLSCQFREIDILGLHVGAIPIVIAIIGLCGIAHGVCTPASNNACIELMPEKVATITGLRGMFRQLGSVLGISISTVLVHSIGNAQRAFFVIFIASASVLLLSLPFVFLMPASPTSGTPAQQAKG